MNYAEARPAIRSGDALAWSHRGHGRSSGVYEIVNVVNGKRYIGSAKNLADRKGGHERGLASGTHHSVALQRASDKYGVAAFIFHPLLICAPEMLLFFEQRCIDHLKPEYNCCQTAGSVLGFRHSDVSRKRMSDGQRRRAPPSEESKAKTSVALKGRPKSPAHAAKIAAAKRGVKRSEEQRRRISIAHIGLSNGPHTEQHKARISAALKGKRRSADQCARIKAACQNKRPMTDQEKAWLSKINSGKPWSAKRRAAQRKKS